MSRLCLLYIAINMANIGNKLREIEIGEIKMKKRKCLEYVDYIICQRKNKEFP